MLGEKQLPVLKFLDLHGVPVPFGRNSLHRPSTADPSTPSSQKHPLQLEDASSNRSGGTGACASDRMQTRRPSRRHRQNPGYESRRARPWPRQSLKSPRPSHPRLSSPPQSGASSTPPWIIRVLAQAVGGGRPFPAAAEVVVVPSAAAVGQSWFAGAENKNGRRFGGQLGKTGRLITSQLLRIINEGRLCPVQG